MSSTVNPVDVLAALLNQEFDSGVAVSDDGVLYLELQEGRTLAVSCPGEGHELVFYSALAVLTGHRDVVLMMAALACNLHQELTHGGAIGLDLENQSLVFSWRMPSEGATPETLLIALENFCATLDRLVEQLDEAQGEFTIEEMTQIERRARADEDLKEELPDASPIRFA